VSVSQGGEKRRPNSFLYLQLPASRSKMMNHNTPISENKNNRAAWTRALDLVLRTTHVAATSVLFGATVFEVPLNRLLSWDYGAIATGSALIVLAIYHCRHWPYQVRGVMAIMHVGLFGLIQLRPDLRVPLLATVLAVGMVGSHLPKKYRHWSFVHKRVMD
jgi:hypothetical protein